MKKTEFELDQKVFTQLCRHFKFKPKIDLFASRLNKKLKRYYSYTPNPGSEHVNAFTTKWGEDCYIFPPFVLINRCLQKIENDRCTALAVLPLYPNQPWYSNMLRLAMQKPILLPHPSPITLPWDPTYIHPNSQKCQLIGVILGEECSHKGHSAAAVQTFVNGFDKRTVQCYGGWAREWLQYCFQFQPQPYTTIGETRCRIHTSIKNEKQSLRLQQLWVGVVLPSFAKAFHCSTITKYCKSLELENPRVPHIKENTVWDKEMVLDLFRKLPKNSALNINVLSKKTAVLILLCTARRLVDLVNLNLSRCVWTPYKYTFILSRPAKTYSQDNFDNQKVEISHFREKIVCPYDALSHYIAKTSRLRTTQFFIHHKKQLYTRGYCYSIKMG